MPAQSTLHQVLTYTLVAAGGQASLPHNINFNGRALIPDILFRDDGDFSIVLVTTTAIVVQNNSALAATLNLWLFKLHTLEMEFGARGIQNLNPLPFVPAAGAGGGGGIPAQAFRYIATGLEGSDFMVNLPAARPNDTYKVFGNGAGMAMIVGFDFPDILAGDRTTTQFRVVTTAALTAGDQIDLFVTN